MIIELENELLESRRREMEMVEARKKLEQILLETQSSNVEVEKELEIAEKKLEVEQLKASNIQKELEQLTKDHAIARRELYDEIRKLKRALGKSLKISLTEGVDLEFEEFVDIAEYVEDEDDENKPLNTSISQGKKTKTFNKLISYWQTRSTGRFKLVRSQKPEQANAVQQQTKSIDSNRKSIDSATSKQMPSAQGSSASVTGAQSEVISRFFLAVGTSENMSDCSKS
eukprot:TRINITY_DN3262_c0_g1_i3.p1 TRINITY_DN3262_c0_g1~~TRINITY_DN3262_c0_g1_i3.p1  ORF type:complete len:228 (-),score=45.93 TRINITY_DN3262_c0_g1_i3:29-712(-)